MTVALLAPDARLVAGAVVPLQRRALVVGLKLNVVPARPDVVGHLLALAELQLGADEDAACAATAAATAAAAAAAQELRAQTASRDQPPRPRRDPELVPTAPPGQAGNGFERRRRSPAFRALDLLGPHGRLPGGFCLDALLLLDFENADAPLELEHEHAPRGQELDWERRTPAHRSAQLLDTPAQSVHQRLARGP
jgi:hypothetical protein